MIIVRIQNFQSILDQTFEFESLSSIIGPTDRGKSAIKRALASVFYNIWEEGFLRRGTKKCIITVTLPEKYPISQIIQEKGKGINSYLLKFRDGRKDKPYPKMNKKVPEEIKALGFEIIETERKDKFNLNFHHQYDPLFLVVQPEPLVTSFFNSVFKITKYEGALRKLTADKIKLNREYEANEEKLEKKQEELQNTKKIYDSINEELNMVNSLVKAYDLCGEEIEKCNEGIEKLNKLISIKKEIEKIKYNYTNKMIFLDNLNKYITSFSNYGYLKVSISNFQDLDLELKETQTTKINLEGILGRIGKYLDTYKYYVDLTVSLNNKVNIYDRLNKMTNAELSLKEVKQNLNEYYSKYQSYCDLINFYSGIINLNKCIGELEEDSKYKNETLKILTLSLGYKDNLEAIYKYKSLILKLKCELMDLSKENNYSIQEYNRILDYEKFVRLTVKMCPICQSILKEGHEHKDLKNNLNQV